MEPKSWEDMTSVERWWLYELWRGNLKRDKEDAEARCHRVQAADFVIYDDA